VRAATPPPLPQARQGLGVLFTPIPLIKALFSSLQNIKSFQDFSSHRISRYMYEALNVGKK
jgi:hypothetical protein